MSEALPRVLCVDDERNLLTAFERNLYKDFDITTATSGAAGIEALDTNGPFEVIVSDMRMPNMDGATFFARVRESAPDTVRILLTGQADTASAIKAINEGAIFRFLTKPCSRETLVRALNDGIAQYRLQGVERQLLESTLTAAVKTLSDVLSLVAPLAFQRANFAQSCVRHALSKLQWPNGWMYDVAAALSQIGCVGIPAEVLQNDTAQRELAPDERALIDDQPNVARRLIEVIPRLGPVAEMVQYQAREPPTTASAEVVRGAQLLRAALELQRQMTRTASARPLDLLRVIRPPLPEYLIQALADFRVHLTDNRNVKVRELMPGWVADEDIVCQNGIMVLAAGSEITETAIAAMRRLAGNHAIREPIRVRCIR